MVKVPKNTVSVQDYIEIKNKELLQILQSKSKKEK